MKKTLKGFFVAQFVLLLFAIVAGLPYPLNLPLTVSDSPETVLKEHYVLIASDGGVISQAENTITHSHTPTGNVDSGYKTRQKQQETFACCACYKFTLAKNSIFYRGITSKRQQALHSLLVENRRLRI